MVLKELLDVLPDSLEICVECDGQEVESTGQGIVKYGKLQGYKVLFAEPYFSHILGKQSFNVKVETSKDCRVKHGGSEIMLLKELLQVLPDSLDIFVEHDERKTGSLVQGIKQMDWLIEREVLSAEPNFVHSVGIQSFNVKLK